MSTMKTEGNLQPPEEPSKKKPRVEEFQENAEPGTILILPLRHPLPLELNCEIYKCLPVPIQTKFIWGISRGIYAAFRHKLLVKTKRLRNSRGNRWIRMKKTESISRDGLEINASWKYFFANLGFSICSDCRKQYNDYPGTIVSYFEVTQVSKASSNWVFYIGLTNNENAIYPDSYAFSITFDHCYITDKEHTFEWPNGAIKPKVNGKDDVVGCGLLLNPLNEVSIFFTGNGILMGKQIQIKPSVDSLYPIVSMPHFADRHLLTNFGDDPAKPFKYDIEKCPGLGLD